MILQAAPRSRFSCCLSIVIIAFAAAGCGAKSGQKGRLSETKAGFSANRAAPVIGRRDLASNPNVALGYPRSDNSADILISRDEYVVSWSPEHRTPNWVAWHLQDSDMGKVKRTNSFALDADLDDYLGSHGGAHAVEPQDFQGTCFDRGHMAPSADRTASADENRVTFLMSNMMPQTAYLNRFIWEHLEEHERNLVRGTSEAIYLIAGGIYTDRPGQIGPSGDIAVPSKNFKILLEGNGAAGGRATVLDAVIMPNSTSTGTDPVTDHDQACEDSHGGFAGGGSAHDAPAANFASRPENHDWENYRVSIDEIARATGLDLSFAK